MSYYNVKIIRVGQPSIEMAVDVNATIKTTLESQGIATDGVSLRFNGTAIKATQKFPGNGDLVISKPVAGA